MRSTRSGFKKSPASLGGVALVRLGSKRVERAHWLDLEGLSVLSVQAAAGEDHACGLGVLDLAAIVAVEDDFLADVETVIGKSKVIGAFFFEGIVEEPFDQCVKLAVLFEDVEDVVIPSIFADQVVPASG